MHRSRNESEIALPNIEAQCSLKQSTLLTFHLQAQLIAQARKLTNVKKPATVRALSLRTGETHEIYRRNGEVRGSGRGGFASRRSTPQIRCSAHSQSAGNAKEERRRFSQCLPGPRNMQPSN